MVRRHRQDYAAHAIMLITANCLDGKTACGDAMNLFDEIRAERSMKENSAKNGRWKEFNKHAVLVAEGLYVNDLKHGTWREYYDHTGTLMIEENYEHGVPHGTFTSYHPNGNVLSHGEFVNGERQGFFRVYDEEGNHLRNLYFVNNIQVEPQKEHPRADEKAIVPALEKMVRNPEPTLQNFVDGKLSWQRKQVG